MCEKDQSLKISQKILLRKMFQWTLGKPFREPRRESFEKCRNSFWSMSEKDQ